MANMYVKEMVIALNDKVVEMTENLETLLNSDVSENTKKTQKFQRTKEIRELTVMLRLLQRLEQCNGHDNLNSFGSNTLSEEEFKWFESFTTLTSERKAKQIVEVTEGDSVMGLMQKYADVKDIYKKMMSAAEKAGLKADFAKGIFVKA